MPTIGQQVAPQFPPDVMEKLVASMKEKLPYPVDDAVINDIIETNMKIAWEYVQSIPVK